MAKMRYGKRRGSNFMVGSELRKEKNATPVYNPKIEALKQEKEKYNAISRRKSRPAIMLNGVRKDLPSDDSPSEMRRAVDFVKNNFLGRKQKKKSKEQRENASMEHAAQAARIAKDYESRHRFFAAIVRHLKKGRPLSLKQIRAIFNVKLFVDGRKT